MAYEEYMKQLVIYSKDFQNNMIKYLAEENIIEKDLEILWLKAMEKDIVDEDEIEKLSSEVAKQFTENGYFINQTGFFNATLSKGKDIIKVFFHEEGENFVRKHLESMQSSESVLVE